MTSILRGLEASINPGAVQSVPDGTAIIQIGDRSVSFTGGEVVTATSLTLRCTAVTPDTVTLVVTPA